LSKANPKFLFKNSTHTKAGLINGDTEWSVKVPSGQFTITICVKDRDALLQPFFEADRVSKTQRPPQVTNALMAVKLKGSLTANASGARVTQAFSLVHAAKPGSLYILNPDVGYSVPPGDPNRQVVKQVVSDVVVLCVQPSG
jgi:hypothetical protein